MLAHSFQNVKHLPLFRKKKLKNFFHILHIILYAFTRFMLKNRLFQGDQSGLFRIFDSTVPARYVNAH